MIAKLRILHLVESLDIGGMENGIVNLANHIDYSHFDYGICCFSLKGKLAERLQKKETKLFELHYGPGFHLGAIFRLSKLFKKSRVDIVHTHGWGARSFLGLLAAKLARVPICINGEHGVIHDNKKLQFFLQKIIASLFDGTLSVSISLKKKLINRLELKEDSITVISNGVDTSKFHGSHPTGKLRDELISTPDNPTIIAVVGSLKQQKNQQVVLEAVKLLKDFGVAIKLLLIGDGPDREFLKDLAVKLDLKEIVFFLGARNDIAQLLSFIDILVLPSIPDHEGMSNVILEAMASKVPVVTTISVGTQELIENNVSGMFFHYDQPDDLAQQLRILIDNGDIYGAISSNALKRILQHHSIEVMVKNYENYYYQVAGVK